MSIEFSLKSTRAKFPALQKQVNGRPAVFFDGPAGTQVPTQVVDAFGKYLLNCNANHGGSFATAIESDAWMDRARQAFADFLNADHASEIVFGQNMTSLTFAFSRALAQTWEPGEEIIVTRLDHDANVTPWVMAAADAGVNVRYVDFRKDDFTLDLEQYRSLLSDKTRLVALGAASNATGGINPVRELCELAHEFGALTFVDAVHYGPHDLIDVRAWDCDFLCCSAYKFFGPHLGIMWGRTEWLERLDAYQVRPAESTTPWKWMTGTQSFESIAAGMACVDYLAEISGSAKEVESNRRAALEASFQSIRDYERDLSRHFLQRVSEIPQVKVWGITDPERLDERFPTFSITHYEISSSELARRLGEAGIFVWNGNYYALQFTETLGLEPEGMVRIGLVHYNGVDEVDRLIEVIKQLTPQALVS